MTVPFIIPSPTKKISLTVSKWPPKYLKLVPLPVNLTLWGTQKLYELADECMNYELTKLPELHWFYSIFSASVAGYLHHSILHLSPVPFLSYFMFVFLPRFTCHSRTRGSQVFCAFDCHRLHFFQEMDSWAYSVINCPLQKDWQVACLSAFIMGVNTVFMKYLRI